MTFKYSLEDYIKQAEENKGSSLTFRERQEVKKNYKKAFVKKIHTYAYIRRLFGSFCFQRSWRGRRRSLFGHCGVFRSDSLRCH